MQNIHNYKKNQIAIKNIRYVDFVSPFTINILQNCTPIKAEHTKSDARNNTISN